MAGGSNSTPRSSSKALNPLNLLRAVCEPIRGTDEVSGRVILIWAFAASVVLTAQSRLVPAPDATLGFQAWRRLQARDLRPVDRLLQEARRRQRSSDAGRGRQVDAGAHDLLRADLVAGEPRRRSIAIARSRSGCAHPQGLTDAEARGAGARRQGVRPHRRRPALDRGRRPAAHAAARLRPASAGRRRAGDRQGDPRQRHPDAVADDQSRRPADGRRLVHEERRHAVRASGCRSSTRSTSATTTTATPTCST